jgi:hypothetical protein
MKPQPTTHVSFRFAPEIRRVLEAIKKRDGIPISEQMRRAILLWIATKDRYPGPHSVLEDGIPMQDLVNDAVASMKGWNTEDGRKTQGPRSRRMSRLRQQVKAEVRP